MRILFLSDFYPPIRAGGYAQLCQEVAQGLGIRGHQVSILTSNYQHRLAPPEETNIFRKLHLEGALDYYRPLDFLLNWKRRYKKNLTILREVVTRVKPDVLLVWNLRRLSKSLAGFAEQWIHPQTAYYLAGFWPVVENMHETYWRTPPRHRYMRLSKRLISSIALRQLSGVGPLEPGFRHVMCVSRGLKDALVNKGLPVEGATVVYNGIDPTQFSLKDTINSNPNSSNPFRLIYAGQIIPQKGVHTAVEALDHLIRNRAIKNIHLTILGNGHPDYESYLRNLIVDRSLRDYIEFLPPIPREQMPALLHRFNAMVLPSIYEEPLARSIQEAMACGLVVLVTLTGGSKEIIIDRENGLGFIPGDAESLASQLERLISDPDLQDRLAKAGRKTIVERFDIRRTVDEIETYLSNISTSASAHLYSVASSE